jgi:hypothetical protein
VIWTVTTTIQMAGLNVLTCLTAYLDECSRNGGKPLTSQRWNDSCPGTPAPKPSAPGHCRRPPAETRANTPHRRHHETAAPAVSMPFHRNSEYLRLNSSQQIFAPHLTHLCERISTPRTARREPAQYRYAQFAIFCLD